MEAYSCFYALPLTINERLVFALTSFSVRTLAIEATNAIDAGSTIETSCTCTVINVDAAVRPGPAVHAYTRITAMRIRTCSAIVAQGRPYRTFIHVQLALRAREGRRTQARVLIHPVHASGAILTEIARTIINVLLAMISSESWKIS